ncbi:unnamed protein product [Trichobilharzia regenti]|nr:unnamed protein product [Trichobilharzia regenti]
MIMIRFCLILLFHVSSIQLLLKKQNNNNQVQLFRPNRYVLLDSRVHSITVKNVTSNQTSKKSNNNTTNVLHPFIYSEIPMEINHLYADHDNTQDKKFGDDGLTETGTTTETTSLPSPLTSLTSNSLSTTKDFDSIFNLSQFSDYEKTFSLKCLQSAAKPPHVILFNDGLFIRLTSQFSFRFWPIELIWIEMDEKLSE